jgi:hypothetical protein
VGFGPLSKEDDMCVIPIRRLRIAASNHQRYDPPPKFGTGSSNIPEHPHHGLGNWLFEGEVKAHKRAFAPIQKPRVKADMLGKKKPLIRGLPVGTEAGSKDRCSHAKSLEQPILVVRGKPIAWPVHPRKERRINVARFTAKPSVRPFGAARSHRLDVLFN